MEWQRPTFRKQQPSVDLTMRFRQKQLFIAQNTSSVGGYRNYQWNIQHYRKYRFHFPLKLVILSNLCSSEGIVRKTHRVTNVPILHTMNFFNINKSFAVDLRHCLQQNLCRRNRKYICRISSRYIIVCSDSRFLDSVTYQPKRSDCVTLGCSSKISNLGSWFIDKMILQGLTKTNLLLLLEYYLYSLNSTDSGHGSYISFTFFNDIVVNNYCYWYELILLLFTNILLLLIHLFICTQFQIQLICYFILF